MHRVGKNQSNIKAGANYHNCEGLKWILREIGFGNVDGVYLA
jgi:hypothetical protein